MKASPDAIIQCEQAEYLDRLIAQPDSLLLEMEAYGAEHRVPSADREVARFVEITAQAIKARRALEIGMAIGYTTIHLARALGEDGCIERGKALEVIPRLRETFDLVFIDALKDEYSGYLESVLPKLRTGGVVIVDNLLWGGKVASDADSADRDTAALQKFNQQFIQNPRLKALVLPVGDGLGYAVKIG